MNKYGQALLKAASKLDAVTDACGEITRLASAIVTDGSRTATIALLKRISETVSDPKRKIEAARAAQLVNSSLIEFYGYSAIQEICKPQEEANTDTRSLQELLEELDALVGLEKVKHKVQDLIVYQKVQKMRREKICILKKVQCTLLLPEIPEQAKQPWHVLWVGSIRRSGYCPKGILSRFQEQT